MSHQHVVQRPDGTWAVLGEGNSKDTSRHGTQQDAISRAQEIASNQRGDVIVHNRQGRIRTRDSYGNDPYPPKG